MERIPHTTEAFEHYPEINLLKVEGLTTSASIDTPSTLHPELARTKAALYAQKYLHGGTEHDWQALTRHQREPRLTQATFMELHQLSHMAMGDLATHKAVEYVNYIHDSFKNPVLMRAVGLDPAHDSHDDGLRRIFQPQFQTVRDHYLPSFTSSEFNDYQRAIIQGVLSANFNMIRFVQSQASEEEIAALTEIPRNILLGSIMHGIHDLAGAMGHKDEATSLTLDEPAAIRLLDAAYALTGSADDLGIPPDTEVAPQMRRLAYLTLRAHRLNIETIPERALDQPYIAELVTKLTVADLLRSYSAEDFAIPQAAFNRLPLILRHSWSMLQTAPLWYPDREDRFGGIGSEYAPAFLRSYGQSEDAMYLALGHLAQIHTHLAALPAMQVVQGTPQSEQILYSKVNFYHLANWRKEADGTDIASVRYEIKGDTVTPYIVDDPPSRERHTFQLFHPDCYKVDMA